VVLIHQLSVVLIQQLIIQVELEQQDKATLVQYLVLSKHLVVVAVEEQVLLHHHLTMVLVEQTHILLGLLSHLLQVVTLAEVQVVAYLVPSH
jgi:hypothetical protein